MGMLLHRHIVEDQTSTMPVEAKEKSPVLEEKKVEDINTQKVAESDAKQPKKASKKATK